ncbi:unnamed protein product, partial [Nesidiocoris tenuis]
MGSWQLRPAVENPDHFAVTSRAVNSSQVKATHWRSEPTGASPRAPRAPFQQPALHFRDKCPTLRAAQFAELGPDERLRAALYGWPIRLLTAR